MIIRPAAKPQRFEGIFLIFQIKMRLFLPPMILTVIHLVVG
jgi:hypothetical protein